MNISIEDYLIEKNYPVSSRGGIYYSTLLEEVVYSMTLNMSDEEIRGEIHGLAVEYYKNFFKIDGYEYFKEMKKFCSSVIDENDQNNKETVEEKLIRMGREIISVNDITIDIPKKKKKRKKRKK